MQDKLAIVGVPALAGIVTALVLTGPAQERPALGARARGVVTVDSDLWALRVETLTHFGGLYSADAGRQVELALAVGDGGDREVSSWRGVTDAEGVAEARLQLEPEHRGKDRYELRLRRGGQLLSRTSIQPSRALRRVSPALRYSRDGDPHIELVIPRGILAPPFAEPAELLLTSAAPPAPAGEAQDGEAQDGGAKDGEAKEGPSQDGDAAASARERARPRLQVTVEAQGARVRRGDLVFEGCQAGRCRYRLPLTLTAQAPAVEVDIRARRDAGKAVDGSAAASAQDNRWSGALNVHNGAIWLDPAKLASGSVQLRAAVPKQHVYLSLLTAAGRRWGAVVPMTEEDGFFAGTLKLPEPIQGPATLIAAGDALEPRTSATWPASPDHPMVEPKTLSLLADGMPAAQQRETQRRARARRPAWGIVLAACLFELFYLWRRFRLSQLKLAQHFREHGGFDAAERKDLDALSQPRGLTWLVALSVALMLMFIVLAGVAAFG